MLKVSLFTKRLESLPFFPFWADRSKYCRKLQQKLVGRIRTTKVLVLQPAERMQGDWISDCGPSSDCLIAGQEQIVQNICIICRWTAHAQSTNWFFCCCLLDNSWNLTQKLRSTYTSTHSVTCASYPGKQFVPTRESRDRDRESSGIHQHFMAVVQQNIVLSNQRLVIKMPGTEPQTDTYSSLDNCHFGNTMSSILFQSEAYIFYLFILSLSHLRKQMSPA